MNTTRKGDAFEKKAKKIIIKALMNNELPYDKESIKIYEKKKYYSNVRQGNIEFDLSIEVFGKGADNPSLCLT